MALALITGLLIVRIWALLISPNGLHGDEAQYWAWAQTLDFGYYSKPPMIAWIIAATTAIFGDAEWAARLGSPLMHSGTAWLLFLIGRNLCSAKAGFWAAACYLLMPAVWLSSAIISTDVALLFFWTLSLYSWVKLRDDGGMSWALLLGAAIGLGFLSKYAMAFFLPALVLAVLFDPKTRAALLNLKGLLTLLLAGLIIAPNLLWNAQYDFATLSHTAENTNLQDTFFHPKELGSFWISQLAVFGPVTFALLIGVLIAAVKSDKNQMTFWLAILCAAPLLLISVQALLSRANANWAVSAYSAAPILLAIWAIKTPKWFLVFKWGVIAQGLISFALGLILLSPSLTDKFGLSNSVKRMRGWPATVEAIKIAFAKGHDGQAFETIAMDNRLLFYDSVYYGLEETAPVRFWQLTAYPKHHAHLTRPLLKGSGEPILLVNFHKNFEGYFKEDFTRLEPLAPISIDLGGGKKRELNLWAGYGYTPTDNPTRDSNK